DMTLSEVEIVMKELDRHVSDETQILFGTAVDGRLGDRLTVTIISSFAADEHLPQTQPPMSSAPPMPPAWEQPHEAPPKVEVEPVNRGRFEKSEPTIVEGEDLDVPTYLRKKIKVK